MTVAPVICKETDIAVARMTLFGGIPHNSDRQCVIEKHRKCYEKRRCRRFSCDVCMNERRAKFIIDGSVYIETHKLLSFCTIAFDAKPEYRGHWTALLHNHSLVWRRFYRHPSPKYIRCLSIGQRDSRPHIHLIMSVGDSERIARITRSAIVDSTIHIEDVYNAESLLGYLFDVNFEHTVRLQDRPRRVRLLSSSKGLKCGFPYK